MGGNVIMKMILIDVEKIHVDLVDVNGLDDYYKYIGCRCIDIVRRNIGGLPVEIVCDDEGLLVDNPKPSAVTIDGEPTLFGNLLIASGRVVDGELTELTVEEMHHIAEHLGVIMTENLDDAYLGIGGITY